MPSHATHLRQLYAAEWSVPANDNRDHRAFRDVPRAAGPPSVAGSAALTTNTIREKVMG